LNSLFDANLLKPVYWSFTADHLAKGENKFYVTVRQPCFYNPDHSPCDYCESGCSIVLFELHEESEAITLRCPKCERTTRGGKYHVGLSKSVPKTKIRNFDDSTRWEIMIRDRMKCQMCGTSGYDNEVHIDHIIPLSKGGLPVALNGVVLCSECNIAKSDNIYRPFILAALSRTHRIHLESQLGREPRVYEVLKALAESLKTWGMTKWL